MKKILLLTSITFLLVSCGDDPMKEADEFKVSASDLNMEITFNEDFNGTLYPSYILGLAAYSASSQQLFDLISIQFEHPLDDYELTIILNESEFNLETTAIENYRFEVGEVEQIFFEPNWDYSGLEQLTQQGVNNLIFNIYVDDDLIESKTVSVPYRSVNECVYGYETVDGGFESTAWMFAAYVNEDHPLVDQFLSEVLNSVSYLNSFDGYQSGDVNQVAYQVAAIWYTLQLKGVKYSSITTTSKPGDGVFSQRVRFFSEVYNNSQANCVDGSAFISSLLRAIGLRPFLVLVPGHMYMGFYTSQTGNEVYVLETTLIGGINPADFGSDGEAVSFNHFLDALDYQNDNFFANIDLFYDDSEVEYQIFDIDQLRDFVQPISID